ncbi:MAG TPA: alkaline phosphatase family protein [Polyangiales bacterium]|nr:alkaline phosphatase family protein [Polyangiales bacterium]
MSTRALVLGFDGADLELIFALGARRLPNLFALMERGVFAHQESVQPPATLPNWTTFLTGVDPGAHGVFDFTTRHGYGVKFSAGTVREAPTFLARLDRLGLACCAVGFPATWPPERLQHGYFVSGWDAPVSFEADRSFVWPPSLYDTLTRRFGPLRFDEVDQFRADEPGWHARLGGKLADKVVRRAELASFLLASRRWDVFAFYFGESDTASHYLWSLYDEGSPRRPANVSADEARGLPRVYEALDHALGLLLEQAPDAQITIVSDHGSGGSSDKVLYLNRALAEADLLAFKGTPKFSTKAKQLGLRISPKLRDRLFRFQGALLPSLLESRARFGAIDFPRTLAFSDELNYFPAVHLNQRGREPHGAFDPKERARIKRRVIDALERLKDPLNDKPVVAKVYEREALFRGPFVERAPDLLLELRLDRGYSYNLMPSGGTLGAVMERLAPADYLGKKGRSLPGSHRPRGLFVAAGPELRVRGQRELDIGQASALVLARLGIAPPANARGTVPEGWIAEPFERTLPEAPAPASARGERGALERRLRALGYID